MNMSDVMKMPSVTVLNKGITFEKVGNRTYYSDPSRTPTLDEVQTVKPFAFSPNYYWVVCPHCQKIHEYPILRLRKKGMLVYGNCKGRTIKGIEHQQILIDESEVLQYLDAKYQGR